MPRKDPRTLGYEPVTDDQLGPAAWWAMLAQPTGAIECISIQNFHDSLVRVIVLGPRVKIVRALPPEAAFIAAARAIEFAAFSSPAAGELRNADLFPDPHPTVETLEEGAAA